MPKPCSNEIRSPRIATARMTVSAGLIAVSGATRPTGPRRVASVVTQKVIAMSSDKPTAPRTPPGSGGTAIAKTA